MNRRLLQPTLTCFAVAVVWMSVITPKAAVAQTPIPNVSFHFGFTYSIRDQNLLTPPSVVFTAFSGCIYAVDCNRLPSTDVVDYVDYPLPGEIDYHASATVTAPAYSTNLGSITVLAGFYLAQTYANGGQAIVVGSFTYYPSSGLLTAIFYPLNAGPVEYPIAQLTSIDTSNPTHPTYHFSGQRSDLCSCSAEIWR